jgi:acetylornithine deacetylase
VRRPEKPPVEVLEDLIRIPSPSGSEQAAVSYLAGILAAAGVEPRVHGRNVWGVRGERGPTLLLTSHVDTVPATPAWTRPPCEAVTEAGRLYGLGAADAKSAVVGLLFAFLAAEIPADGAGHGRGRLVFAATCDEETGGEGLEKLVFHLPEPDAVVIGEPTDMDICCAQKGLVKLEVHAAGRAGHASRPHEGDNAISRAARDILAIEAIAFERSHPLLGRPTLAVTLVSGGTRSNMIPHACSFTVDGRSTPEHPNEDLVARVSAAVGAASRVEVRSSRFQPVQTPPEHPLVAAARAALPAAAVRAFGGVSDLFHVRHCPGIIVGPGSPPQSHQADESIERAALDLGVEGYVRLVEEYFARLRT